MPGLRDSRQREREATRKMTRASARSQGSSGVGKYPGRVGGACWYQSCRAKRPEGRGTWAGSSRPVVTSMILGGPVIKAAGPSGGAVKGGTCAGAGAL